MFALTMIGVATIGTATVLYILADRKVVASCNEHGVFIIICEV